jgi:trans-AT polyketide synthase/acyltransferase/oxidoreductase domain-containing protein
MKTWIFPGQGSQKKGMGLELFDQYQDFVAGAEEILGYSVRQLCLENPQERLQQTFYTQPAMYIVNALSFFHTQEQAGTLPDFVAGHSLGEYNALLAAGAFDFSTGLRLVQRRAQLMHEAAEAADGTMAAVVNLQPDQLRTLLAENGFDRIDIANLNAPLQTVIAGIRSDIVQAVDMLQKLDAVRCLLLKVSGAFHSRYMAPAQQEFADFISEMSFGKLTIPVISNVTARPYRQENIGKNLVAQITRSVNWVGSIQYLLQQGKMEFQELGPGTVLTKLVEKIRTDMPDTPSSLVSPGTIDRTGTSAPLRSTPLIPDSLGCREFREDYGIKYAYVTGGMAKGIASAKLVICMARAGMLGYFGTGGLGLSEIKTAIRQIQQELRKGEAYGMNLLHNPAQPRREMETVDLFLNAGIRYVEAAAFMQMTPALVKFRLKGLHRNASGEIVSPHRIMAKLSRPEISDIFLRPAPDKLVAALLKEGDISPDEAELARFVPMADDLCVESDSAGHTDMGIMTALLPSILRQRDRLNKQYRYAKKIRVGAAGGIGTPEAAGAAFLLGADFILTGSVNQCSVEAGTADVVKDILQRLDVQDTEYAPAGDMFELGAKVQVVRKGLFFPARANKLYDLYRYCGSLDELDTKTAGQIQEKYFHRSFDEVYAETKDYYLRVMPEQIERAERNPKVKMALVFKWYFTHAMRVAIQGNPEYKVDYQIHCGPTMGAFNQWVQGTVLEDWHNRHVDRIAEQLMQETAAFLTRQCGMLDALRG